VLLAGKRVDVPHNAEGLARWPADDPVEVADWRVEASHVATPKQIRSADNAESLLLESHVE